MKRNMGQPDSARFSTSSPLWQGRAGQVENDPGHTPGHLPRPCLGFIYLLSIKTFVVKKKIHDKVSHLNHFKQTFYGVTCIWCYVYLHDWETDLQNFPSPHSETLSP